MKKIIFQVSVLAVLLWIVLPLALLGQATECKAEVRNILRSLNTQPGGESRIKMQISMTIAPRDSQATGVRHDKVTLISGDGKMAYESSEMRVYIDADLAVNVLPGEKTLYLSPGFAKRGKGSGLYPSFQIIDSQVLEGAEVVACGKSGKIKVLEITKGTGNLEKHGIQRIRYTYDPGQSKIIMVRADFKPGNAIAYIQVRYDELDLAFDGAVLAQPVRAMVYASGNTLAAQYKGYKVIKTDSHL
jgi:hypothetical protein